MFKARMASCGLNAASGPDSTLPVICSIPRIAVLLRGFLQAGGLIAKNQIEFLFTFDEVHSGEGSSPGL